MLKFLCTAEWSDGVTKGVYYIYWNINGFAEWKRVASFILLREVFGAIRRPGFRTGSNHKYNYLWMTWWLWEWSWVHTGHTNQLERQNLDLDIYGAPAEAASKTIGYIICEKTILNKIISLLWLDEQNNWIVMELGGSEGRGELSLEHCGAIELHFKRIGAAYLVWFGLDVGIGSIYM